MSLHHQLQQRAAEGRPIRVGLIGAGKFGSMYLAQVPRTPGVHLVAIADLSPEGACATWRAWAGSRSARRRQSSTPRCATAHLVGDDWQALVAPGDRHRRRVHRRAGACGRPHAWRPSRTASTWST
jgi:predicted homoserine dehydrogenase-like protein